MDWVHRPPPRPRRSRKLVPTLITRDGAPISGSLAETLNDHTSAASGESKIVGTVAETLADHISTAAGVTETGASILNQFATMI